MGASALLSASVRGLPLLGVRCRGSVFEELVPDPAGVLDLLPGLTYSIIGRTGDRMYDGLRTPGCPDGMGAFALAGGLTGLVCNHELRQDEDGAFADQFGGPGDWHRERLYDAGLQGPQHREARYPRGGTTTIHFDTRSQRVLRRHLSLGGTMRNCGGGATPWGTWISCEEYIERPELLEGEGLGKPHGYAFEVSPRSTGLARARPLAAMGCFRREAVAFDEYGAVLQTEDREDGVLYRFVPDTQGQLHNGGRLYAMRAIDAPGLDTSNRQRIAIGVGQSVDCDWVEITDTALETDDSLRRVARARGAAIFAGGEGMARASERICFAASTGGPTADGQIWAYQSRGGASSSEEERGVLSLVAQADGTGWRRIDSLGATPDGSVLAAEDGGGTDALFVIDEMGSARPLARNALTFTELTGPVISPDGTTLFVNIQNPGLTLAITCASAESVHPLRSRMHPAHGGAVRVNVA